jgi:hypothetical protein
MTAITREQLVGKLDSEIAAISDAGVRASVEALRVHPTLMTCEWGYSRPSEIYPCWKVAEDTVHGVGIVHCEQGFGPRTPWGLVWLHEPVPAMGQDSGWFSSFRETAADILDLPAAALNV